MFRAANTLFERGSDDHTTVMTGTLEFWPDYGSGPLWTATGDLVSLEELGLPTDLATRLAAWNSRNEEGLLPLEGPGTRHASQRGRELLRLRHFDRSLAVRAVHSYHVGAWFVYGRGLPL